MPLQSHSTDEGANVGAWALLDAGEQGGVRRSGRALTPNVRNAELSAYRGGRVVPRVSGLCYAAMRCVHVVYVRREVTLSYHSVVFSP